MIQDNIISTRFWGTLPEVLIKMTNYIIQRPEKSLGIWSIDLTPIHETSGDWYGCVYECGSGRELNRGENV